VLSLCSLASGSSGNCYLLRAGEVSILVDCGISARRIVGHLRAFGVEPASLAAILLTHEHSDHVQSLGTLSRRYGLPVIANEATLAAAEMAVGPIHGRSLATGQELTLGDVSITSFAISHDAAAPVGYLITHLAGKICLATDLGVPSPAVAASLAQADLLVVEANHDRERLINGPYPMPLKARILGNNGHLSNLQAAQLLEQVATDEPKTVWLAHLSEVNNTPKLALRVVSNYLDLAGITSLKLEVALRDRPSAVWRSSTNACQIRMI